MKHATLALALLLCLAATVRAEDAPSSPPAAPPVPAAPSPSKPTPPPTPEQAADAVLAAIAAKDGAALEALARNNNPDPWFVADEPRAWFLWLVCMPLGLLAIAGLAQCGKARAYGGLAGRRRRRVEPGDAVAACAFVRRAPPGGSATRARRDEGPRGVLRQNVGPQRVDRAGRTRAAHDRVAACVQGGDHRIHGGPGKHRRYHSGRFPP